MPSGSGSNAADASIRVPEQDTSEVEDSLQIDDAQVISGDPKDELLWFLQMVGKLCIPMTIGYLSEAQHYDPAFLADSDPIRGAEGSKVDGALYLGEIDMSTARTYAEKLDRFERLATGDELQIAGEDIKAPTQVLERGEMSLPALIVTIRTRVQNRNAAHYCVHFAGAPHMRLLLPVGKDAQFEWQFGSFLSYHIPIPPRMSFLAFPYDSLQDARRQLKQVYKGEAQRYEVPVSNVLLPPFEPNLSNNCEILNPHSNANDTFEFLRTEIAASMFAQTLQIRLDFSHTQPLDGDARLTRPDAKVGEIVDKLELKYGLVQERRATVVFSQPFGDTRIRMRHSPFHPLRMDNFVVLFAKDFQYVYWIPASRIAHEWWTDAEQLEISRADIVDLRVRIAGNPDWFEQVYERIIEPNPGSMRKPEPGLRTQLNHYAVGRYVDDDDYVDVKYYQEHKGLKSTKSKPDSPWWSIERGNQECAHRRYGIWFPLGHRERIVQAVFVGYEWDETDKLAFESVGRLPAALHTGDLSPYTPCLLIRMASTVTRRKRRNGIPSYVSGVKLDKGPLPCLYYIDARRPADLDIPSSKILVPEELIDFELRNKKYTERIGKKKIDEEITTARQVVNRLGWSKALPITEDTDLRELVTVPLSELMVREYRDQQDALEQFLAAHENKEKPLSWSSNLRISATWDYAVTLANLQQAFADVWTATLKSAWWTGSGEGDDEEEED